MKKFLSDAREEKFKIHLKVDANLVADTRAIPCRDQDFLNIFHRISKLMQNEDEWKNEDGEIP